MLRKHADFTYKFDIETTLSSVLFFYEHASYPFFGFFKVVIVIFRKTDSVYFNLLGTADECDLRSMTSKYFQFSSTKMLKK